MESSYHSRQNTTKDGKTQNPKLGTVCSVYQLSSTFTVPHNTRQHQKRRPRKSTKLRTLFVIPSDKTGRSDHTKAGGVCQARIPTGGASKAAHQGTLADYDWREKATPGQHISTTARIYKVFKTRPLRHFSELLAMMFSVLVTPSQLSKDSRRFSNCTILSKAIPVVLPNLNMQRSCLSISEKSQQMHQNTPLCRIHFISSSSATFKYYSSFKLVL
ncbi:hypothetical protein EAF04_002182 [Stromatinia cepivora]|nr:hypothetical protein EAF04_002182 [Stromatinia cepivora]